MPDDIVITSSKGIIHLIESAIVALQSTGNTEIYFDSILMVAAKQSRVKLSSVIE
jgi:hypothetical protein